MFWKRKNKVQENRASAEVIEKAARWVLSRQRKGADQANGVVARMPIQKLKMALAFFCLLAGGASAYLVIGGITGGKAAAPALTIEQASIPGHFDKTGDASGGNSIDRDTYARLQAFKSYMDSLSVYDPKAYDSFLLTRPGLVDTVRALEEMYLTK